VSNRFFALIAAIACAATLGPAVAAAQEYGRRAKNYITDPVCPDDAYAAFHECASKAAKNFDPPRTADGHPDMSGLWRRRAASAHESLEAHPGTPDDTGGPSLVVDPADGIVPMQPWAKAESAYNREHYVHHNAACLLSGVPGEMYMTGVYQFFQSPKYFALTNDELHAFRTIPLDGRPHVSKNIKLWNGDAVGHWEGDTLVIDTTNQNGMPWLDQRGRFYTEEAHVVERLTMIGPNTIHYQATLDDPNVYTRPFTIAFAYRRNSEEGFEIWEDTCYESNAQYMEHFKKEGYGLYPGISAAEARAKRKAWEAKEAGR
jgi:hypothetical protein